MDPGQWTHPNIPACQMLCLLISGCLQFKPDYWLQHLHPDPTKDFASGVDESIHELVQMCMGINIDTSWSNIAKERARVNDNGLSFVTRHSMQRQ